jgi:hypothetical protein
MFVFSFCVLITLYVLADMSSHARTCALTTHASSHIAHHLLLNKKGLLLCYECMDPHTNSCIFQPFLLQLLHVCLSLEYVTYISVLCSFYLDIHSSKTNLSLHMCIKHIRVGSIHRLCVCYTRYWSYVCAHSCVYTNKSVVYRVHI